MRGLIGSDGLDPDPDLTKGDAERIRERFRACLEAGAGRSRRAAAPPSSAGPTCSCRRPGAGATSPFWRPNSTGTRLRSGGRWRRCKRRRRDGRAAAEDALRDALAAPRERLLRQFNALADGGEVPGRSAYDLMRFAREDAALSGLEKDLKRLLASWFDAGFLKLRRIDWTPRPRLLEKLIDYEAVHAIRSWQD